MVYFIKLYLAVLVVFFAVDMVWLGVVARNFYRQLLGYLLAPSANWIAAVIFYLLFVLGLLVFVLLPGLKDGSLMNTLSRAALYGLITYATYDLTNLATVKDFPLLVAVVDMAWGTVLSVVVGLAGYFIGRGLG